MLPNHLYPIPQREPPCTRSSCNKEAGSSIGPVRMERRASGALAFSMAISTDNVVFDREPLKVDRLWAVVATHPSGQQEHIVGFHTEAEACEWRASHSCEAWLRTRGYTGWRLRELRRRRLAGRKRGPTPY